MSQRGVELVIGRLATDEAFRRRLAEDGRVLFQRLAEQGAAELTAAECRALASTPFDVWEQIANAIDPRLQKVSFRTD